jgi:hypothetical protein
LEPPEHLWDQIGSGHPVVKKLFQANPKLQITAWRQLELSLMFEYHQDPRKPDKKGQWLSSFKAVRGKIH